MFFLFQNTSRFRSKVDILVYLNNKLIQLFSNPRTFFTLISGELQTFSILREGSFF
jgi:hypothetical protein